GESVVDLWGGHADAGRTKAWEKDTLCVIMSCTKGAAALCAHLLAAAGELDFDEPVRTYWPEFAAAGKNAILVRHLLTHQAGLPDAELGRVASFLPAPLPQPGDPVSPYMLEAVTEPGSIPWLVMQNNGGYLVPGEWDSPAALTAELPSSGGVANARSLEAMYR